MPSVVKKGYRVQSVQNEVSRLEAQVDDLANKIEEA